MCYTHDSPRHKRQVLDFGTFLVSAGVDVCLDQWQPPVRQDWYRWALGKIPEADFVLAIASPDFHRAADGRVPAERNRGAQAEATVLRELLQRNRPMWTRRILPVVLPGRAVDEIPLFLQPLTADHYMVDGFTEEGAKSLLAVLRREPAGRSSADRSAPTAPESRPPSGNVQKVVSNGNGAVFANQGGDQTIHYR
ncbi:SEFIR domain-containing protein [Actinosynnema sp. NPDC091369]